MRAKYYPAIDEAEVCRLYQVENKTILEIARIFLCRQSRISEILSKHDVIKRGSGIPERREKEICERYLAGESIRSLRKEFQCRTTAIINCLTKCGVEQQPMERYAPHFLTLRRSVFDLPLLEEDSRYWVGFIAADGYVGPKVASIVIGLAKKDIHHLERFLKFIGHPGRPQIHKSNGGAYIQFKSRVLHSAVCTLRITPQKSARECAPEILKHDRHFWRGYVDGDGSFYWLSRSNSPMLKLLGSKKC
jgi:hypothetical protein